MEETSHRVKIPIETFIKRSWPVLLFGAVLLLLVTAGLIWYAVSGVGRKEPKALTPVVTPEDIQVTTTTSAMVSRALDGILVPPDQAQLQAYAVMVENETAARPLTGPAKANLAFEFPVEGGITRYMLVFDATTTVDAIGPVRSARPYFVDLANAFSAVYAHVGGSPEALDKINGMSSLRDLNEFTNGKYFWRTAKLDAPHNVLTRTDLLHEAAVAKKFKQGHFNGWHYKGDDALTSATSTVRGNEDGPTLPYGGAYDVSWTYVRADNVYERHQAGDLQKDADGSVVRAKNVVVLETDGQVTDSEGRLHIRTTGRGKATLYRDGTAHELVWTRSAGSNFYFETLDGTDALFDRGTTWVEVQLGSTANSTADATSTASGAE